MVMQFTALVQGHYRTVWGLNFGRIMVVVVVFVYLACTISMSKEAQARCSSETGVLYFLVSICSEGTVLERLVYGIARIESKFDTTQSGRRMLQHSRT